MDNFSSELHITLAIRYQILTETLTHFVIRVLKWNMYRLNSKSTNHSRINFNLYFQTKLNPIDKISKMEMLRVKWDDLIKICLRKKVIAMICFVENK